MQHDENNDPQQSPPASFNKRGNVNNAGGDKEFQSDLANAYKQLNFQKQQSH